MNITVHISSAIVRGTPVTACTWVLRNLSGERFAFPLAVEAINIAPAEPTAVPSDGQPAERAEAREILEMARTITSPAVKDGYFEGIMPDLAAAASA